LADRQVSYFRLDYILFIQSKQMMPLHPVIIFALTKDELDKTLSISQDQLLTKK